MRDRRIANEARQRRPELTRDGHQEALYVLQELLAEYTTATRYRMLDRLEQHPEIRNLVQAFWDINDTALYFRDQRNIFEQMMEQAHRRYHLHSLQCDEITLQLYRLYADDILLTATTGTGTPEDPIDAERYGTPDDIPDFYQRSTFEAEDDDRYHSDRSCGSVELQARIQRHEENMRRVEEEIGGWSD